MGAIGIVFRTISRIVPEPIGRNRRGTSCVGALLSDIVNSGNAE